MREAAAAEPLAPEPVDAEADDTDALEALGEEIVVLAAHLHAGRARFLALVAAFDRRRGWEP
ncbi:MAG TPA: hypothetical protein VLL48_08015, partial [Longimicrobiales bacterium]|nr:hypothetical protein [Longimicrobiales bacterium]